MPVLVRILSSLVAIGMSFALAYLAWRYVRAERLKPDSKFRAYAGLARVGIVALALFAGYFAFRDCFIKTPAGSLTTYTIEGPAIECPFKAEGGLFVAFDSGFAHMEPPNSSLCQKRGSDCVLISTIKDLRGHVALRSGDDALAFVRLFSTARNLVLKTPRDLLEIMPRDAAKVYVASGHDEIGKWVAAGGPEAPDGAAGIVSRAWFDAHKLHPPRVVPNKNGWKVERVCIREEDSGRGGHYQPVQVIELVGRDGTYSRADHPINLPAPKDGWSYGFMDD